jgi:hypothetical protein
MAAGSPVVPLESGRTCFARTVFVGDLAANLATNPKIDWRGEKWCGVSTGSGGSRRRRRPRPLAEGGAPGRPLGALGSGTGAGVTTHSRRRSTRTYPVARLSRGSLRTWRADQNVDGGRMIAQEQRAPPTSPWSKTEGRLHRTKTARRARAPASLIRRRHDLLIVSSSSHALVRARVRIRPAPRFDEDPRSD